MNPRTASDHGFTLIETLVALAVATTAATVILALIHGHIRRAAMVRAASETAVRLLNDRALLALANWRTGHPGLDKAGGAILEPPLGSSWPILRVENMEISEAIPPPPVAVAYTPFQRFGLEYSGRALWFIAPALQPPPGP